RRRQSSSVSVLLPTGDHNPSVSEGTGDQCSRNRFLAESREAEIPRITFTIRNTSLGPLVAQAFLPVFFRGRAVAIFSIVPQFARPKCVSAGINRHAVGNERVLQERSSETT